jgi:hypothetical protein
LKEITMIAPVYAQETSIDHSWKLGPLSNVATQEEKQTHAPHSFRWLRLWNGFMVASAALLLVVDQKGPFGDAAKWFFCALIFAGLRGAMKHFIS